ncbi:hypothetical protein LX36DRAFT_681394 [Colletotrichum falcatum]|nr:hypothetical protein LX36DRAFT_681394 [Colletotrichum falcatum]
MAKKKAPKRKAPTSFLYPHLHERVSEAVAEELPSIWFNHNSSTRTTNNEYPTYVMGKFVCDNCPDTAWTSKKVSIVIRGYPNNGYNATVFSQRCSSCNNLGNFTLDEESYIERVAYRLKNWAGIKADRPFFSGKDGPPHRVDLCEGCKQGYCQRRNSFGFG